MIKHLLMILIIVQFSLGQQTQEGAPYSQIQSLENNYHTITLPQVNNDVLLEEDTYRVIGTPYRYGYKHEVFYTPANFGTWNKTSEGGLLWQASFTSEDAYAISFEYKNFHIPEGGQLYVYTPDYEMIIGAYTYLNNTEHRLFSTPLIKGDTAIIEYYQPANVKGEFSIQIIEIIHDYRDIMDFKDNGRDWECGVNVICETEGAYQGAINSVAFLDMGGFICSGAMVNNVRQDLTPYFLTAWHCVDGDNPSTFRFYFNKMASSCENTWGSAGPYAYSSDLVAHSDGISHPSGADSPGGDWALLLIDDEIEEEWEVFYAGWDVTENYPNISCGVHHPGGTPKKINYDDDIAYGAWWDNASHGLTHWQVNWDEGGSEGGSSGSPVFNERFQIVGVLTGGSGECGEGYPDLYGKLYLGWNWEMNPNRRMIDWLDPDYTGTLVIDGTYVEVTGLAGDLNADDTVNILDIIQLANLILSSDFNQEADLNNDGTLNILDIVALANIILNN
tara:strand:- start:2204 stop:3715 length:1512 start_codon:yes stop_codon:yes gene_type:complete